MSAYTIEMNSVHKDTDSGKIRSTSPVVEVFSAMVRGADLPVLSGNGADKAVKYIKSLGEKASNGDGMALCEMNALRRFTIEPALLKEIQLMGLFGTYRALGYGETPEAEVYFHEGEKSRFQAANGDVTFPAIVKKTYQVPTQTISGGYAVDYRKVALGDMSKENEGMEQVRIDIRNKASLYAMITLYNAVKNAVGVKYFAEDSGITKTNLDGVLTKVRRWGKPSIVGDYSVVSQVNSLIPYTNGASSSPITGVSQAAMEEIRKLGLVSWYNGSAVVEVPNQYDVTTLNTTGDNFKTVLPEGLLFVIPQGVESPVRTWTRGGLTSFSGNDVTTGHVMTRFDLDVAVDVAKGQEHRIGIVSDTTFGTPTL